ncbi:sensor histidine kinase [Sinosporangium album]|nr:histidine kinase [Sinosporangium album]
MTRKPCYSLRSDAALAFGLAGAAVVFELGQAVFLEGDTASTVVAVSCAVAMNAPITWRRSCPAAALTVVGLGYLGVVGLSRLGYYPSPFVSVLSVCVITFSVIAEGSARLRAAAIVFIIGFIVLESAVVMLQTDALPAEPTIFLAQALMLCVTIALVVAAGDAVRQRHLLAAAHAQRADQAERLRELDARAAADDERLRLARDLHDVVASRLSAAAMRINAAEHVHGHGGSRTAYAAETLTEVGKEIGEALQELRGMLGVIRAEQDGSDDMASPSISDVHDLADQARREGTEVAVVVSGHPRPLPRSVDLAAYRILREALTNVAKHARPSRATVRLDYGDECLGVRVDDFGDAPRSPRAARRGYGITGMRERANLCGGSALAGPRPGGGWTVVASLPISGGAR